MIKKVEINHIVPTFCHYCGKPIEDGTTSVFMLGYNFHSGCDSGIIMESFNVRGFI